MYVSCGYSQPLALKKLGRKRHISRLKGKYREEIQGRSGLELPTIYNTSSSSPCGWGPSHLIASSTFVVNDLHFPLSSVMVFHSWPFVPALSRSCLTQSFYRSFGLPLLLLPPSSAFNALFDSLSSPIHCTCPAHLILLQATFIFRCFFMPISSLNSFIFLLSSWVTLHILRTQLIFAICIFSSCLSVSASVPNPHIQAGTTQASNTFPFSCFFSFLSHNTPTSG